MEPGWETPEQACLPKRRTTAWENLMLGADRVTAEAEYFGRRGTGPGGERGDAAPGQVPHHLCQQEAEGRGCSSRGTWGVGLVKLRVGR